MEKNLSIVEEEIVVDSLSSESEEIQPLGNLMQILSMKSKSPDAASSQDSNKTYMDSPELIAELDCHVQYQVTSDDDTCLSSNIGSPTVCQSQISLFSSQKNNTSSAEKLAVPLNHDVAPTSSQNVSIDATVSPSNNRLLKADENIPKLTFRKSRRKKKNWSRQRFSSRSYISSSQTTFKTIERKPPYYETHCVFMEEINVIESKLSSVEKLLSTKLRRCVDCCAASVLICKDEPRPFQLVRFEQADTMMKNEIMERIKKMKLAKNQKNYLSQAYSDLDSSEEEELSRLYELKQTRLKKAVVHQRAVMEKLEKELNRSFTSEIEDTEMVSSQSLIPTSVRQRSSVQMLHPYKLRNSDSKKVAQLSEVIQLPKLSNSSVVYVPVISTAKSAGRRKKRQKIASSVMTSTRTVTTVTQSPSLYFKTVAVTASKVSENENQPPKMMRSLKPQPSPSKDLQSPQTQIMELPLSPCNVQSPTLAVNYAHANPKLSRVPIARSSPHEISSLQSQAQTKIQINQPQTGAAAVVVSQSNLECRKTLPDIGDMFKLGFIFRGEKVLSYQCEDNQYFASVIGNGLILAHDYQIYVSPMTWIKALNSRTISRVAAYKKVLYRGISLYDLVKQQQCNSTSTAVCGGSSSQNTRLPVKSQTICDDETLNCSSGTHSFLSFADFVKIYRSKIRLVKDEEFFVSENLWSEENFFS